MTDLTEQTAPASSSASDSAGASATRRLPVWVMVVAFVVLLAFLALIGWGLSRSMRGALAIGDTVPEFGFTTFDGQPVKSTDFTGKVLVVNFWASWCKPCEQEARELEQAYQHYLPDGKVVFLGMTYSDTEPNSLAYIEKFGITYPNGPDLATRASQMFRVTGVPETYILDTRGRLAFFKAGPFTSTEEIISVIDGVLAK